MCAGARGVEPSPPVAEARRSCGPRAGSAAVVSTVASEASRRAELHSGLCARPVSLPLWGGGCVFSVTRSSARCVPVQRAARPLPRALQGPPGRSLAPSGLSSREAPVACWRPAPFLPALRRRTSSQSPRWSPASRVPSHRTARWRRPHRGCSGRCSPAPSQTLRNRCRATGHAGPSAPGWEHAVPAGATRGDAGVGGRVLSREDGSV